MKTYKAKINLALDILIGIAFLIEAITGLVLALVLPHGGFQGGRNALYNTSFIIGRSDWLALHDGFAVVMVAGVLAHVVLHWRWIACMVRNLWREAFATQPATRAKAEECGI